MNGDIVPLDFASSHCVLTWDDLLWAYGRHMLTWKDLVTVAEKRVDDGIANDLEFQMAGVNKENIWKIRDLEPQMTSGDSHAEIDSEKKWLRLALKWSYENRELSHDPLGDVEKIYADFDYPPEIESFVRYMPPSDGYDPTRHSMAENHARLLENWRMFVGG